MTKHKTTGLLVSTVAMLVLTGAGCMKKEVPASVPEVAQPDVQVQPTISFQGEGETVYPLDLSTSSITWTAMKKIGSGHSGKIMMKEASLTLGAIAKEAVPAQAMTGGQPMDRTVIGGRFVFDMNSLVNTDITDAKMNEQIVTHLKGKDFFDVEQYPEAVFTITSLGDAAAGGWRTVSGTLEMHGKKVELEIPAQILVHYDAPGANGKPVYTATATFTMDRTKWDLNYGSGQFFKDLGDNMIEDEVSVTMFAKTASDK